jgi:putative ABC transport system permease protein
VNLVSLAARNVLRNKFRTTLTVLGVAVALLAFILLRTVLSAWNAAADYAAKDRIATRHKVTFIMTVPKRYVDTIRQVPGVSAVSYFNWFGAKYERMPNEFFGSMACDPRTMFDVYDDVRISEAEKQAFIADRQGAIVGDVLARKMNWHAGDTVTLKGTIFPGNWTFHIVGVYTAASRAVDRSTFFFQWDYLNESLPPGRRDQVGWIMSRVDNATQAAAVSQRIDRIFDIQDVQTLSMSERALNVSFLAGFSAILQALNVISVVILLILLLVLGNTIAMGVRERTNEYGVLRALGFMPKHVRLFIYGEAITLGAIAGTLGAGIGFAFVNFAFGPWLEENMGAMFPYFRVPAEVLIAAFVFAVLLGILAAIIPATRAARLTVTDALRRID